MATSINDLKDLTTIQYDIDDAASSAAIIMKGLNQKRFIVRDRIYGFDPSGETWKHALDEVLPQLAEAEAMAFDRLGRLRKTLREDAKHLDSETYRCGLLDSNKEKAATRATQLLPLLSSMTPDQVAAEIRSSLSHRDPVEMAAWATLTPAIQALWPDDHQVTDSEGRVTFLSTILSNPLREARRLTGDKKVRKLGDELTETIQTLTAFERSITAQRNAHEPASFGTAADTFVFGQRDMTEHQRTVTLFDPDAVEERLKPENV